MNFAGVQSIAIPEGDVKSIAIGGVTVWQKPNPLPYDAEVEYVQANGIAYIDTGVPVSMDYSVKCVGEVVSYGARSNVGLFGFWVRINSVEHTQRVFPSINSSAYGVRAQTTGASISTLLFSGADPYGKHTVECNHGAITVDGVSQTGNWSSWADSSYTQHLFGIKQINPTYGQQAANEHDQQDANTVIRIYSASWTDGNGNLVRDFVPCRVGTEARIYDRVTGEFFAKQGYGTFTPGPDKT